MRAVRQVSVLVSATAMHGDLPFLCVLWPLLEPRYG